MTNPTTRTLSASFAALIIAASGLAGAAPEDKKSRNKELLRGPRVTHTDSTNSSRDQMNRDKPMEINERATRGTSKKKNADRAAQDRPISVREYFGALRQMQNPRGEGASALSESQREDLRAIMSDHREAMQKFMTENKEKIDKMRERVQEARKNAQTVGNAKPTEEQREKARAVQERMRTFMENAPANKEAMTKIKTVLSADQFAALEKQIKANRSNRAQGQRLGDRMTDRERPAHKIKDATDRQERADKRERPQRRQINREQLEGESVDRPRGKRPQNRPQKHANPDD